jgi:molecular chaperone HscA
MLAEARVEAGSIIEAVAAALAADSDLISAEEKLAIEAEMQHLQAIAATDDAGAIHHAVEALNHATESFAAARMDASVKRALSGKELNTLDL